MNNYFITDRTIKDLTIVVSVGGAATSKDVVSSYRPFFAFGTMPFHQLPITARVSDKKLDGIIARKESAKNPQAFCTKSTQFILRNIGAEISFSTAKEVLGQPTRKGKFLVWPTATFEQEIVMIAIDQCHDRCNSAIYNGVITIGHQQIKVADYLKKM